MRGVGREAALLERLEARCLFATVTWDGGGGDLSWHNPANWSGDALPGASDDVILDLPGPQPTITLSQPGVVSIRSLICNEGLSCTAGVLTVASDWRQNGPLTLGGTVVTGAGNLVVNTFNAVWTGGQLSGEGRVQLLPGSRLRIAGDVSLRRTLVNNGTLIWASGNLGGSGATIYNLAGRVFHAQSAGVWSNPGGALINSGTLYRSGTSISTTTIAVPVNSPGVVDIVQGTLALGGPVTQAMGAALTGGAWRLSATSSRLDMGGPGLTTISAGASVLLNGPGAAFPRLNTLALNAGHLTLAGNRDLAFTPAGGVFTNTAGGTLTRSGAGITSVPASTRLMNAGTLEVLGGAWRILGGLVTSGGSITVASGTSLTLSGGTATINGGTISGGGFIQISIWTTWNSGTWSGPGSLSITAAGTLALASAGMKVLSRPTTSNGTIWWADGPWQLGGVTLSNAGLAKLSYAGELTTTGVAATLSNSGTVRKLGPGILTLRGASGGVRFVNTGLTDVREGRLILSGGGSFGGQFTIGAGCDLSFGGLAGTVSGAIFAGAGTLTIANATTWTGGTVQAGGGMTITAPASLSIIAGSTSLLRNLTNQGTLGWSGGGLSVGAVTILNIGTLNLSAPASVVTPGGGATLRNTGTINKTGGTTTTFFAAQMTIDSPGTVNVSAGELAFNGSRVAQIAGATLAGGTWNVSNGSLRFVGSTITTNAASLRLSGFGAQVPSMVTLNQNTGTLEITDGAQPILTPAGGTLVSSGSFTLGPAASVRIFGALRFTASSVFTVVVSGPIPFSDVGFINADGPVTAGGQIIGQFTGGYNPAIGAAFDFLTTGSSAGSFAMTSAIGLPAGKSVQFAFVGSAGRLTVVAT